MIKIPLVVQKLWKFNLLLELVFSALFSSINIVWLRIWLSGFEGFLQIMFIIFVSVT